MGIFFSLFLLGCFCSIQFDQPALAVTGENNHEIDLTTVIIKIGIIAFWYLLIMPVSTTLTFCFFNLVSILRLLSSYDTQYLSYNSQS